MPGFQPFAGLKNKTASGISQGIIGQAQAGGLFDPMGSPRLRALRRRRALQLRDAARQRGQGAAQLYGLDPMQQRQALINSDIAQSQGITSDLLGADFEEAQSGQQFARGLLGGQLDFERQRALEKERARQARAGGIGSAIGSIAGAVLPGLLPARAAQAPASTYSTRRYSSGYNDPYGGTP